jgi:hypothetical protein
LVEAFPPDLTHETMGAARDHTIDGSQEMPTLEFEGLISRARDAASAATYDIQQLPEDTVARQALHNLLTAVDALIAAVESAAGDD